MWIRTKSISCQEFFHGMQEIIVEDTPVTLFMGEDEPVSYTHLDVYKRQGIF